MPGPITHLVFYKQLKERLSRDALRAMPDYDRDSIFAQGHDLLIYHNFYKISSTKRLNEQLKQSSLLQEYSFPEFIYSCLRHAQRLNVLDHDQIRTFLGPGYIAHHILDACTHPFIIYEAGDHTRDPKKPTWLHGIIENRIDVFMMEQSRIADSSTPLHPLFSFPKERLDPALPAMLDAAMEEVYHIQDGGRILCQAMSQVALYMRLLKQDRTGIKRLLFDALDPVLKGTASFSYHQSSAEARSCLNEEHELWCNPMDDSRRSTESFQDLYDKALAQSVEIIEALEALCRSGEITRARVFDLIPDIASTHGLACGQSIEIRFSKPYHPVRP